MFKELFKKITTFIAYYSGFIWIFAFFYDFLKKEETAIILGYHHIVRSPYPIFGPSTLYCREKTFEKFMRILSKRFHVISLAELVKIINKGERIPKRCVVVTFDDGFKDNFEVAFPILLKYKIPATIFLTTGAIGTGKIFSPQKIYYLLGRFGLKAVANQFSLISRRSLSVSDNLNAHSLSLLRQHQTLERLLGIDLRSYQGMHLIDQVFSKFGLPEKYDLFLSWGEIKEMNKGGVDFGAHTVNHPRLSTLTYEEQEREIVDSKKLCDQNLGKPVTLFCYPFGDTPSFNQQTIEILQKNGFQAACSIERGRVGLHTPPLKLPRRILNDQAVHWVVCEVFGLFEPWCSLKRKLFHRQLI